MDGLMDGWGRGEGGEGGGGERGREERGREGGGERPYWRILGPSWIVLGGILAECSRSAHETLGNP